MGRDSICRLSSRSSQVGSQWAGSNHEDEMGRVYKPRAVQDSTTLSAPATPRLDSLRRLVMATTVEISLHDSKGSSGNS